MVFTKILVLGGGGDIGSGIAESLCSMGVDAITVGDIDPGKAGRVAESLSKMGCGAEARRVNALDITSLREVVRGIDVIVNAVGPFYRFGFDIARNLVSLGLNFVDICDDYDATEKILGLNDEARKKSVLGLVGLGWTPGISNILALHGARRLSSVRAIDIYWVGSAADSRGLAVVMHLFHALMGRVPMYINGGKTYVEAGSGGVPVSFPEPIGRLKLYYTGHPEPITLPRYISVSERVTVRGGLIPSWQNGFAKFLLRILRIDSDEKAEKLARRIHRIEGIFRWGGLELSAVRVDVTGSSGSLSYVAMDRMRRLTGIPAALGAIKIARGELRGEGIAPPEAIVRNTEGFLGELLRMGIKMVGVRIE